MPLLQARNILAQSAGLDLYLRYSITHIFLSLASFSTHLQAATSSGDRGFFTMVGRKLGLR